MNTLLRIGIIGDFSPDHHTHLATNEALMHGADMMGQEVRADWLSTETLDEKAGRDRLADCHGLFCAPGGPYKSTAGALAAIGFAREKGRPFLGT